MKFCTSSESDWEAHDNLVGIDRTFKRWFRERLTQSILANLEIEVRYVPIVMGSRSRQYYPARSRALIKQQVYSCCPQLDHETFARGGFPTQVREYVRGLKEVPPQLKKFGATKEHREAFEAILVEAPEAVIALGPTPYPKDVWRPDTVTEWPDKKGGQEDQ